MNFPGIDDQQISDQNLRGFLLKNIKHHTQDPTVKRLNNYLIKRVDQFWVDVVEPLRKAGRFDANKIQWYFQIYREGLEAKKVLDHPFLFIDINEKQIQQIVDFYQDKTLNEYLELGTSFLSNSYTVLSSWMRDQLVLVRLEHVYSSDEPVNWIFRAEAEEHGAMEQKPDTIPEGLMDVVKNIGLIMAQRA